MQAGNTVTVNVVKALLEWLINNNWFKIIRNILYKIITSAELGLTGTHQTHIGLSENFIQNWYLKQKLQVKLNIILSIIVAVLLFHILRNLF